MNSRDQKSFSVAALCPLSCPAIRNRVRRLRMRLVSAGLSAVLLLGCDVVTAADNWGEFRDRPLRLQDLVPPDGRRFLLEHEFDYADPAGRLWKAPPGLITDGASIPKPFWGIIGGPFEGLFREAAIVHDAACCSQTEAWQDV